MTNMEAVKLRHSVRKYTNKKIEGETLASLQNIISECNSESGLNIQLCVNEPKAFAGMMAKYGNFTNVSNYIALVGKKSASFEENCGYYGEKIVIEAQKLGLNTCWVAATYSKGKHTARVNSGEKLLMVISIGYGENHGVSRKTKPIEQLCKVNGEMPDWFKNGMESVQLAPTAMNQQKFSFELTGNNVKAAPGSGFYTKTDLGIAKYHFELGAENGDWKWES